MQKLARKILRAVADYDPDYYDMYADPNEAAFATLYLTRITRHAEAAGIRPPARVLEAGCQAGRLVVPLAKLGFDVTGIDTSGFALRRAAAHATAAGVDAAWLKGDLVDVLAGAAPEQYDLVICAEVVYLSPQYREMLRVLARAARPGGLLCVSHRPLWYYLIEALRAQDREAAADVLRRREGPFRETRYVNWQTEEELRSLYASLGVAWLGCYPIDRLAWLTQTDLSQLSAAERAAWLEQELTLAAEAATCARYALVVAQKPHGAGG